MNRQIRDDHVGYCCIHRMLQRLSGWPVTMADEITVSCDSPLEIIILCYIAVDLHVYWDHVVIKSFQYLFKLATEIAVSLMERMWKISIVWYDIVLYQDCNDNNMACHRMHCALGEIRPGSGITLRLFFRLWNHTFTEVLSNDLHLHINASYSDEFYHTGCISLCIAQIDLCLA